MLDDMTEKINSILPQTQCGKCDFNGCKPYANAISEGKADINQCPPGGEEGILKIAQLLKVEYKPLNERHGLSKPREIAIIEEDKCIGCTLCILACPVDAILGASKSMHTVISEECTGCELCIEPCPVDCIKMEPSYDEDNESIKNKRSSLARSRYEFKQHRILREESNEKANRVTNAEKKQVIADAMARLKNT